MGGNSHLVSWETKYFILNIFLFYLFGIITLSALRKFAEKGGKELPYYICNKNVDEKGRHEIHVNTCGHLPLEKNQLDLGFFNNCQEAIKKLESDNVGKGFTFDGCYYCSPNCHRG